MIYSSQKPGFRKRAVGILTALALVGVLLAVTGFLAPGAAHAKGRFALRTHLGLSTLEGEMFLGPVGLMVILQPAFDSTSSCTGSFDRTYLGGRFFFSEPKSSWYLGYLNHSDSLTGGASCGGATAGDGGGLIGGYHWMLGSFTVDLGLRPNTLAFGFVF